MVAKVKILYVEHEVGDADRAKKHVTKAGISCEVQAVTNQYEFVTALKEFKPDVIISDDALQTFNTPTVLNTMKENGLDTPVIAIVGPGTKNIIENIVFIMKQGAYDCLIKKNINKLPGTITETLKKQEAKKITNHDLSRFVNVIDEVFFSRDMLSLKLIQISPGCEAVYGYTTEEFIANPEIYFKLYHPDDSHIWTQFITKLRNGEEARGRYRIIHRDNTIRWIDSKITPKRDANGMLIQIDGVSRDVTQAKMAEDSLKLSERRYRQIVETAQEGIWIINENLETVFVNQKTCDILGYAAEEIIGKHNYDFKDEVETEKTLDRLKNRTHRMTDTHESAFITKGGGAVLCNVITNGLFNEEGQYVGTLAMLTDITQRKAGEDALRRSKANLSAIIENTTDLVYSLDSECRFITFNQLFKNTVRQVYGFVIEQGINILDLLMAFDAEAGAKWRKIYTRALNGETQQFVIEYPVENGKIYLSYSVNPIWETGKVIGLSVFSRDITRQKLDEVEIKKSAANLTAIIENTDANVYSLDTDLKCITFNKSFKSSVVLAYGVELKPGDNILDFLRQSDPQQADEWAEQYALALSGKVVQFTKEFQISNAPAFISFSLNPIRENDKVIGLSCSARDITKQTVREIAIRKSEASLKAIFNNTDMACLLIDTAGRIVSFNNLAKKFLQEQNGVTPFEGFLIMDVIDPERRRFVLDVLERTKNGTSINYQLKREVNGITSWFDMTWEGIKDQEKHDYGHIFTVKNITEKKKLEIEREKITSDLLQRNKALEQFTYIISHNLRAPVANIIGLSSLVTATDTDSKDFTEIIKSISRSANKLDGVILDLNQVLQINEDINENIESISLSKLIDDIRFSIRNLILREQVTVVYDFDEAEQLLSLKSFIHSIFYNLLVNSIKYRNPGIDPVIKISTKVANGRIQICFKDNGRGIDIGKYGSELFGLYKRFDTSVEGKGMGLFMIKIQVESLGGNISLNSKLNEGTEFTLEFPQMHLQNA